jgi:hypothetical protein
LSLDQALDDITTNVPECLATGWIDPSTGTLVEVNPVDDQPQDVLDLIAASTAEILQGANAIAIEELFNQTRDVSQFREIVVLTHNFIHVFARDATGDGDILVIVARITANLGAVISRTRAALAAVRSTN